MEDPRALYQKLLALREEAIRRRDVGILGRIDGLLATKPESWIEAVAWMEVAENILRDAEVYWERGKR